MNHWDPQSQHLYTQFPVIDVLTINVLTIYVLTEMVSEWSTEIREERRKITCPVLTHQMIFPLPFYVSTAFLLIHSFFVYKCQGTDFTDKYMLGSSNKWYCVMQSLYLKLEVLGYTWRTISCMSVLEQRYIFFTLGPQDLICLQSHKK